MTYNKEQVLSSIRAKLHNSDWTQLSDSPKSAESKLVWATYRVALRTLYNNLPEKEIYTEADFPQAPE